MYDDDEPTTKWRTIFAVRLEWPEPYLDYFGQYELLEPGTTLEDVLLAQRTAAMMSEEPEVEHPAVTIARDMQWYDLRRRMNSNISEVFNVVTDHQLTEDEALAWALSKLKGAT